MQLNQRADESRSVVTEKQMELIMEKHGLISFIVHPDYIVRPREHGIYEALLGHLDCLREERDVWITTPGELNRWWRQPRNEVSGRRKRLAYRRTGQKTSPALPTRMKKKATLFSLCDQTRLWSIARKVTPYK